jgi:hypothetical protein
VTTLIARFSKFISKLVSTFETSMSTSYQNRYGH